VVVARTGELQGYAGPMGRANIRALNAAPFLPPVQVKRAILVYQVVGAQAPPVSPLLKGPYLHCLRDRRACEQLPALSIAFTLTRMFALLAAYPGVPRVSRTDAVP
jgi:hypothetical protein